MSHQNCKVKDCIPCMLEDMDRAIAAQGLDPARYGKVVTTETRTRYAKPGTRTGNGIVRKLSPRQVKYIKRLMIERDTTNLVRLPGSENIEFMSLAGARDLIDRLLACPEKKGLRPSPATDKQKEWLKRLGNERVLTDEVEPTVLAALAEKFVSFDDARTALDYLFKAPKLPTFAQPVSTSKTESVREGVYETADGTLYRVRMSEGGHLYASRIEIRDGKAHFEYEQGAMRKLTPDMRVSLERGEELSRLLTFCLRCGIHLTATTSIDAGIGPICRSKW